MSEEEYYASLLANPDYAKPKFSIYRYNIECGGKDGRKGTKLTEEHFVAVWNKCKDVADFLYGTGKGGSLTRNIKLNNKRGKLGFSKKGYIWSFFAPQRKEGI